MRDNNSANWQETAAVTGISSDLSRRIIMDELAQFAHVKMTWKSVDEAIDQFASAQPEISQIAVLLDLHSIMDISGQSINSLFDILLSHKASIAVLTDLENLDEVYGLLARGGAQFIVGEEAADIMLAMSLLTRGKKMGKVFDPHSDEDTESLSKISSELLEFARAISRIAQTEAGGEISAEHLADKPIGFRAQQSTSQSPFLPRGIGAETSLSAEKIRDLIRLRRMRDRFFKADLFADPAWDIFARFDGGSA